VSFMDEHGAELHQLFLESAQELVQNLNDEALQLETRHDAQERQEALRDIRRIVHTLKGDSAACGLAEFSGFAHEVESKLEAQPANPAQMVMEAADRFTAMLRELRQNGFVEAAAPKSGAAQALTSAVPALRVDAARIDTLMDLTGELLVAKLGLQQAIGEFSSRFPRDPLRATLADVFAQHTRILAELQHAVLQVRMVEVARLFRRMPRVLRDVAQQTGKQITLEMRGTETKLDRSVLDALAEPLMHLVRNAADHGIEPPEVRRQLGKPEGGAITLAATQQANQVVISITDDGGGIDPARLRARAVERGMLSADEAAQLTDQQTYALIFEPGFSTAEQISAISGRGVGMDVVKSVVERLSGSVQVESSAGVGTIFRLQVPLTLAILRALLFKVADCTYAIPVSAVMEIVRLSSDDVVLEHGVEWVRVRDVVQRLVRIAASDAPRCYGIAVAIGTTQFVLAIDQPLAEENLVIKGVSDPLIASETVSGAAILGDGRVVMVLNLLAVFERAARTPVPAGGNLSAEARA
jgi:two-component system chemotaxis sensor kinase CheA